MPRILPDIGDRVVTDEGEHGVIIDIDEDWNGEYYVILTDDKDVIECDLEELVSET